MGFMDKLKDMAEKVGDTVEKGAKNVSDNSKKMAEKMRLKKEIGQVENDIKDAYIEIGKKYFELNSTAPSEDYAENVNSIIANNAKIEELKAALNSLEDKIPCPGCGANLDKTQKFCDKCGAKVELPEPVAADVKKTACPKCNAEAAEGQKFCEQCGSKLDAEEAAETEKVEAEVVEEPTAE